jgi:uncharacterized protein GlcG (DUF336 family)
MLSNTRFLATVVAVACLSSAAIAAEAPTCSLSPTVYEGVLGKLAAVVKLPDANGGIFKPNRMWAVVVDRAGVMCNLLSIGDAWPGSRAIAIAKAVTANAFSNDALALSTANLYGPTQPGGSLYGLNNSNPFNPEFLPIGAGHGEHTGGIITFGGGVALYEGGKVIGGLGVSGDSSCADHAIAYRMRRLAHLDGIPNGVGPGGTDNIAYADIGTPVTGFQQPHCFPSDITP